VPFIIFWLKPYTVFHGFNSIIPVTEFVPDTLHLNWDDEVSLALDSIKRSYKGKRYMFPKPPYNKVSVNGLKDSSKLRFKGDYLRHLNREEWSFRLKNKKSNKWRGNKKINFHHPAERLDINEYVFQKYMIESGHLALDYDFSLVVKNGLEPQLYAYEECIDRNYLTKRKLKGEILRFDEGEFFNWIMFHTPDSFPTSLIDKFYISSKILPVGKVNDQILFAEAKRKLLEWRLGKIKTSEIFNVEKTADFLALSDIWGAQHGIGFNNIKLFFDADLHKFELIATDGNSSLLGKLLIDQKYKLFQTFFANEEFKNIYLEKIDRYKHGRRISMFLLENLSSIKSRVKLLEHYYPNSDNNLAYLHYNFKVAQND
tara:strand:- start:242 stop:1354 length:1113 start_codon:yes stop_codon:yes gene_type:complete